MKIEERPPTQKKGEYQTGDGAPHVSEEADPDHLVDVIVKEAVEGKIPSTVTPDELLNEPKYQAALNVIFRGIWFRFRQPRAYSWEDLRQDTLTRFWAWLPKYRGDAKPTTVLVRMAINRMISVTRYHGAKRRDSSKEVGLEEIEQTRPARRESHEQACNNDFMIQQCRANLFGTDLVIFDGRLEEKDFPEIARELNISKQAVAMRWSRIKKRLRHILEDGGDHPGRAR